MTKPSSAPEPADRDAVEGDDQVPYAFSYGHGRMPLFLKVFWLVFIIFATSYVVIYLLSALGEELAT